MKGDNFKRVLRSAEDQDAIIACVEAVADYQDRNPPHNPMADPLTPKLRAKLEAVFREIR